MMPSTRFLPLLPLVAALALGAAAADPVPVYVLVGQSNMEGKAKVSLLEHQASQDATKERFAHLRDGDGWVERDDVFIKFLDRKGPLTVGFGSPGRIGPELDFGHVVGDAHDGPVVIVKCAWGGKSLYRDFRPPSAGLPDEAVLAKLLENAQKRKPETTMDEIKEGFGHFYRLTVEDVKAVLEDLGTVDKSLSRKEGQLAGMVWFQGWNDMVNADAVPEYESNMVHFIKDMRRDLDAPDLPFVIGQMGHGGKSEKPNDRLQAVKDAQAGAADADGFDGNVAVVETDQYWDETAQAVFKKGWKENLEEWETVGSDYPYHYLGSAKTFSDIGRGFGEAVLALEKE